MKKFFTLTIFTLLLAITTITSLKAQNDVYWREGFDVNTTTLPGSASDTRVLAGYYADLPSGNWYFMGAYRSTGTACAGYGAGHLRMTGTVPTTDSVHIVTPSVEFGVKEVHFSRCRSGRYFGVYYRNDTTANIATGWIQAAYIRSSTNTSTDTTILINSASAKRVMITGGHNSAGANQDSDIDSIWVTSFIQITPVKFASINAIAANGITKLGWTSETEINTTNYIIERSEDGINFTQVGILAATGANKYSWMDNASLNSTSFYRIKGIDKSGAINYSSIVKSGTGSKAQELQVAPNPVKNGQLTLKMNNFSKGDYAVNIYNNAGQKVFTKVINNEGGVATQNLQLSSVNKGVYNLQLTGKSVNMTKRLIVE